MLKLSYYPAAIAQTTRTIALYDYELSALQQVISAFEEKADMIVATDAKLKNESQRQARRFELLEINQEYQNAQNLLTKLADEKSNVVSHLEYLSHQFRVAKLEARLITAQPNCGLEARD